MTTIFFIYSGFFLLVVLTYVIYSKRNKLAINDFKLFTSYFLFGLMLFFFMTHYSHFQCNDERCTVTQYNIYNIPIYKKKIDSSNINYFYKNCEYGLSKNAKKIPFYYIYVSYKDGKNEKFFVNHGYVSEHIIHRLNSSIKELPQKPFYIDIKFPERM